MIRALTIQQPWASLIAAGAKKYEFRKWRPDSHVGERVVVHASIKKFDTDLIWEMAARIRDGKEGYGLKKPDALAFLDILKGRLLGREALGLPVGAGLGTVQLGVPRRVRDLYDPAIDFSGVREDLYGWPMEDFRAFAAPVTQMGAQGLWRWPVDETPLTPEPVAGYRPGVE